MTSPSSRKANRPKVLLDNGEYWVNNKGDLAILDVTVSRLFERWPHAQIGVLSRRPSVLRAYAPGVRPIDPSRGGHWPTRRITWGRRSWPIPPQDAALGALWAVSAGGERLRGAARQIRRQVSGGLTRNTPQPTARGTVGPVHGSVPDAVESADLVIAMGGGYMTDIDPMQVQRTLDLLERSVKLGVPTVMLGQGFGPLREPQLVERCRQVLPLVDLIACREPRRGPSLLKELGVPEERVVVTGDDAVELAYSVRPNRVGHGLGVCVRVAGYSPVEAEAQAALVESVQAAARRVGASLVPLSVSESMGEDRRATAPLLRGYPKVCRSLPAWASARALAGRVADCRVVVTGAYHLAVFALAQGTPVVALSSTEYYDDKFLGLADCFGGGLTLVRLEASDVREHLADVTLASWEAAPVLRQQLLEAARRQVTAGRAVSERALELVDGRQ